MILVKTKIGPSKIHGIGIFADQFIPKGTVVWRFNPKFDLEISEDELAALPEPAKKQFLNYTYLSPKTNKYILAFDDSRFFNHSDDPNCIEAESPDGGEEDNIAARDIQIGEELTCDYEESDMDFNYKKRVSGGID